MGLFRPEEFAVADAVAQPLDCNPFLPERLELEARALGDAFVPTGPVWHSVGDAWVSNPNTPLLRQRLEALAPVLQRRLAAEGTELLSGAEIDAYRGLVLYLIGHRERSRPIARGGGRRYYRGALGSTHLWGRSGLDGGL